MASKIKKDRIFVFVLAVTIAGLCYQTFTLALNIVNGAWQVPMAWVYLIVNSIAIYAVLVLLNNNRKRVRLEKLTKKEL